MDYVNAIKAMDKDNPDAIKESTAYQILARIVEIYKLEEELKRLSSKNRLTERQASIRLLVEKYFARIKKLCSQCRQKTKL